MAILTKRDTTALISALLILFSIRWIYFRIAETKTDFISPDGRLVARTDLIAGGAFSRDDIRVDLRKNGRPSTWPFTKTVFEGSDVSIFKVRWTAKGLLIIADAAPTPDSELVLTEAFGTSIHVLFLPNNFTANKTSWRTQSLPLIKKDIDCLNGSFRDLQIQRLIPSDETLLNWGLDHDDIRRLVVISPRQDKCEL